MGICNTASLPNDCKLPGTCDRETHVWQPSGPGALCQALTVFLLGKIQTVPNMNSFFRYSVICACALVGTEDSIPVQFSQCIFNE